MISVKTVNNIIDAFPIGLYAQPDVLTPEENDLLIQKYINYAIHLVQEILKIG